MRRLLLVVAVLVLAGIACSLGGDSVDVESSPLEIVEVTRVVAKEIEVTRSETPVPLSDIDLEGILLLDGDLPTSFVGQQIMSDVTSYFTELPEPNRFVQQEFRANGIASRGVVVILYEDREFIEDAFNKLQEKTKREHDDAVEIPIEGIGERAIATESNYGFSLYLVFVRCRAVVYIQLHSGDKVGVEVLNNYAKRLDKRINQLVCY